MDTTLVSKRSNEEFKKSTVKDVTASELTNTTQLIYSMFNQDGNYELLRNLNASTGIKSKAFYNNIRNGKEKSGCEELTNMQFDSKWKSLKNPSMFVFRYKLTCTKGNALDVRLHILDSRINFLYYYVGWKTPFQIN